MKIDKSKKVRQVVDENIIISQIDKTTDMTQVVALNESALLLHDALLDKDFTLDDAVRVLLDHYDVDEATARCDAAEWAMMMKKNGLLID